jgi:hypothetical protein
MDDVSPLWDRESMSYDDPVEHLRRTNDGREGFCQILTTTLLVGGTYPKWGTHNALTDQGVVFFKALDELSFGTTAWTTTPVFIDEITMPKRHDDELSASPDWTLVFEDRVWMIELKTERGSHRATQLPHYLDMAAHHYPRADHRRHIPDRAVGQARTAVAARAALRPPHVGGHAAALPSGVGGHGRPASTPVRGRGAGRPWRAPDTLERVAHHLHRNTHPGDDHS